MSLIQRPVFLKEGSQLREMAVKKVNYYVTCMSDTTLRKVAKVLWSDVLIGRVFSLGHPSSELLRKKILEKMAPLQNARCFLVCWLIEKTLTPEDKVEMVQGGGIPPELIASFIAQGFITEGTGEEFK